MSDDSDIIPHSPERRTRRSRQRIMETVVPCDETQKLHSGRDPKPASDRENEIDETDSELATKNHERARNIICDSIRERQASLQISLEDPSPGVSPGGGNSLKLHENTRF